MDKLEAFLRENLGSHPRDLVKHAASVLRIKQVEVERTLKRLVEIGEFEEYPDPHLPAYKWKPVFRAPLEGGLMEDRIWLQSVAPKVKDLADNVRAILEYGTTEMLNNVLDHSEATAVVVVVRRLPLEVEVHIEDDGMGIFRKLQSKKGLEDPHHVALELAKGKLTTDEEHHTGQGIFLTSRMCDKFLIWSDTTVCGQVDHGPWTVREDEHRRGTTVRMAVRPTTKLTKRQVFDEFFPLGADDTFAKTVIYVSLLQQNGSGLVSRSQAKRLLARCDQFREVALDFTGIESIGPAFADEIFRVFARSHPNVTLKEEHVSPDVARMISSARRNGVPPSA